MKSKMAYLLGGILLLLAQIAIFIVELVFTIKETSNSIYSLVSLICISASIVMAACCLALTLCSKNEKTTYAIVVPTVIVNLFLNFTSFSNMLEYLLLFVFRLVLIVGVIFYVIGIFSSLYGAEKEKEPKQTSPAKKDLGQELQKLLEMKNAGLITEDEFNKMKMQIISKEIE